MNLMYDKWDDYNYERQMNDAYKQRERGYEGHCVKCGHHAQLFNGLCWTCNAEEKNGKEI